MKHLVLFLLFGAALAVVADSLQFKSKNTDAERISKCKKIQLYRKLLPIMEKFWKYLVQKYRCEEKKTVELTCGIRRIKKSSIRLKIGGGKQAVENSWPWQVSVFMGKNMYSEDCDGTLIADDWVLTSASCIKIRYTNRTHAPYVRVGDHHILRNDDHQKQIEVNKIIIHQSYKENKNENLNDIALLRLKSKVSLNDHINVACLPKQRLHLTPGTRCTVLGWGMKETGNTVTSLSQLNLRLQELEMPLISYKQCKTKLHLSDIKPSMHICAIGEDGKGTRGGDIGVSLLCPQIKSGRKHWYLTGVFSFGIGVNGKKYEIFTRVSAYSDWIERMQLMYAN